MNESLIKFIELCLTDGIISEKEREVIFRKSKELGVDEDECEIILEGLIQKNQKESSINDLKIEKIPEKPKKTLPLKKIPQIEKPILDKENLIKKLILLENQKKNKTKKELSNLINDKKKSKEFYQNKLTLLKLETYSYLKNLKKGESFLFDGFKFTVNERVDKKNFKNYIEKKGSIQYGEENSKFSPEFPHPISVMYNFKILGGGKTGSFFSWTGKFKYYETQGESIFNNSQKSKHKSVLIDNLNKNEKVIVVLKDDDFEIIKINFSFSLKQITMKQEKNPFGDDELIYDPYFSKKENYHTIISFTNSNIELFKKLKL